MEIIICNQLLIALYEHNGISERQLLFRKARSAFDAIRQVTSLVGTAIEGRGAARKNCTFVTLDDKNAVNSTQWDQIMYKLEK